MSRLVEVDFRIRAQPTGEHAREPLEPQWVKLRMDKATYDRFARLRDELMPDGREGGMIADVERRKVLLEEMHQLAELVYFLDASVVGDEQIDTDARTDLLASVERLEAEHGFKIPARLKGEFAVGQLRMDAPGATRLEAVASGPGPDPTDQDRNVSDPVRDEPLSDPDEAALGRFHADPEPTELAAAVKLYPRAGTQRRRVLDAIARAGERGCTDFELQQSLGIRRARTRRQELQEGGWVAKDGRTRKIAETGNDALVWVLSERGRAEWKEAV